MNQKSYASGVILKNLNMMGDIERGFYDVYMRYKRINITKPSHKGQGNRKGLPLPARAIGG
jgi:hypothetical protein